MQHYYEFGDKGHKFLAWHLKKRLYSAKEINDCLKHFYQQLYTYESKNTAHDSLGIAREFTKYMLSEEDRILEQPAKQKFFGPN